MIISYKVVYIVHMIVVHYYYRVTLGGIDLPGEDPETCMLFLKVLLSNYYKVIV